jgi:hypothetical protein
MRPIVQILFFWQEPNPPQRSMTIKRGKNKPDFPDSQNGIEPKPPRTLILLNHPRKRVDPQIGHLLPPCNTLKNQESAPNYGVISNNHGRQPDNWV